MKNLRKMDLFNSQQSIDITHNVRDPVINGLFDVGYQNSIASVASTDLFFPNHTTQLQSTPMPDIDYKFTKYVPSITDPNNNRPKDTISFICRLTHGVEIDPLMNSIVVAYREHWCLNQEDSTQYHDYLLGNELMCSRIKEFTSHFKYFVNKVDDSIVIVDFTKDVTLTLSSINQLLGLLEYYHYKEV